MTAVIVLTGTIGTDLNPIIFIVPLTQTNKL